MYARAMTSGEESALRAPYTHTFRTGGAGLVAFLCIFFAPVGGAALYQAHRDLSQPLFLAVAAGVALLFVAAYAFFSDEVVTTLDADGIRCVRRRVVGPYRGTPVTELDVRFAKLSTACLVDVKRPSRNGGWSEHRELRFGKHGRLVAGQLGGVVDGVDPFETIAARLSAHLGDRFTREEDLGPLDESVKRLVDAEVAKRTRAARHDGPLDR